MAVVVLTRNRCAELRRTLHALEALPERPEIIVVDNASTDGTPIFVRSHFPDVLLIGLSQNVGTAGRNIGVEAAGRPYVALCDDDCWWAPGSLRRAADLLENHPRLSLVNGRVLIGPEQREDCTCRQMEESTLPNVPGLPGRPIVGFLAGACVVQRQAFLDVGGFNSHLFLGCEERLLGIDLAAAGWQMAYVKELTVFHHPSQRRDPRARRLLLARNLLWVAWLRLPAGRALAQTSAWVRCNFFDATAWRAFFEAALGLSWVLRDRRVIPPHLDWALQRVEAVAPAFMG